MELTQLLYAVTLAEKKNFTRAAEALFITQPTLSQQIRRLEQECGFQLFVRGSKQVLPTPSGEIFITQAKHVLSEYDSLESVVKDIGRQLSGSITIGIGMAGRTYITDCVAEVMRNYADIRFNLVEAWGPELYVMLRERQIDVALVDVDKDLNSPDFSDLNIFPITEEYICALMSEKHALAGRKSVGLSELAEDTILFSSMRSGISKLMVNAFREAGITPKLGMDLNSSETCISFVSNGMGITFATNLRAGKLKRAGLAVVPVSPALYRIYALVSSKNHTGSGKVIKYLETAITSKLKEMDNVHKLLNG